MKFLLLIPLIAVLFSNVPVRVELSLPENKPADCSKMEDMICMLPKSEESGPDDCCKGRDSRCTVICCFQLGAPVQQPDKFRFGIQVEKSITGVYRQQYWSNPYISGPFRPPDHG